MKKLLLTLTGVSMIMTALMAQADMEVCAGKPYTLTSEKPAAGEGEITYQWLADDVAVPGATAASYVVAATQAVVGNYTYVRVASNATCTVSSNVFTVQVRQPGTNGQSAIPCDCASGLTNCSNTCRTPTTTSQNGDCTGNCYRRTVYYFNECGSPAGSGTIVDTQNCTHSDYPNRDYSCTTYFAEFWSTTGSTCADSGVRPYALQNNYCHFNFSYDSQRQYCTVYLCN